MKLKVLLVATTFFVSTQQHAAQIDPNIEKYAHLQRVTSHRPLMVVFAAGPNDDQFLSLEFVLNRMRNRLTDRDLEQALGDIERNGRINPNYGFNEAAKKVENFKKELAAERAKKCCCARIMSWFR